MSRKFQTLNLGTLKHTRYAREGLGFLPHPTNSSLHTLPTSISGVSFGVSPQSAQCPSQQFPRRWVIGA